MSVGDGMRCERLLVGQGDDTYDPVCWLAGGHKGRCMSAEDAVPALEAERQVVLDVVNIYGDDVLHDALDSAGWFHCDEATR